MNELRMPAVMFWHCIVAKVASPDVIRKCPPALSLACTYAIGASAREAFTDIFHRTQLYSTVRMVSAFDFRPLDSRSQARFFDVQLRSRLRSGFPQPSSIVRCFPMSSLPTTNRMEPSAFVTVNPRLVRLNQLQYLCLTVNVEGELVTMAGAELGESLGA